LLGNWSVMQQNCVILGCERFYRFHMSLEMKTLLLVITGEYSPRRSRGEYSP
jgi:hypothetical protein